MIRLRSGLVYIALVSALVAAAIFIRYLDPFFVQALRLIAFDHFQRIDPETYDPNLPIRVVDIDEESLAKIGQWPWPRTTVATLLQTLTAQGAAAVAFDILIRRTGPYLARRGRKTVAGRAGKAVIHRDRWTANQ